MKLFILLFTSLFFASHSFAQQQYHMEGRFVNTTPDISLDSVAFIFTPTTYEYYINAGTTPSSSGTYVVSTGNLAPDSLILTEDTLGICNSNNGGNIIKFELQYSTNPYTAIILSETTQSADSCPSHSDKIQGQYIGYTGNIVFTTSVTSAPVSFLSSNVYNGKLSLSSSHDEYISITVTNLNGQRALPVKQALLSKGQPISFDLNGLPRGIYFISILSGHERKVLKTVL